MKTNEELRKLIQNLKKKAIETDSAIYKRIATDLEKSTRNKRIVNLSKINRFTKDDEFVIVPGKVLGSGELDHKVTIAAYTFSESAIEKINSMKAKAMTIEEFAKDNIKGKKVRILG
jgi:large subunit ribosomal protein L18e